MKCKDIQCKNRRKDGSCMLASISLNSNHECSEFDPGIFYYMNKAASLLNNSNFICSEDLSDDVRIGLYVIMKTYNLGFSECSHGLSTVYMLKKSEDEEALTWNTIRNLKPDMNTFNELQDDFAEGYIPVVQYIKPRKDSQSFGWLSPTGVFTEAEFGDHEISARQIIKDKGWNESFHSQALSGYDLGKDYLVYTKNYVLLHNPWGLSNPMVTCNNCSRITKSQKDFLYTYFIEIGDRSKAEEYLI